MKRILSVLFLLFFLIHSVYAEDALSTSGIIGKVVTEKGPLRMRVRPDKKSRVIAEIPRGTCLLVINDDKDWCEVQWDDKTGYCDASFMMLFRQADPGLLHYRTLARGDRGEDVLALKTRLQELGYIRSGSELTNVYNDTLAERITIFQKQTGMTEDGVASQELQLFLFSDKAPVCTKTLPRPVRRPVSSDEQKNRTFCGCCMGEGCECCQFTGWIKF